MADGRELVPLRTGFDVVLRGYRRGPVRQYVQSVEEELRSLAADRDANADLAERLASEVERLRAENARLERRIDQMCRTPIEAEALPHRLRRMLELAKEEAAEITARAQAAAEHCWATAEEAAGRLRVRYEKSIVELDERRRAMETEHRTLLQQTRLEVAAMTTEADRRCEALDAQAARRREQIETDFDVAMSARRTEAMQKIAEQKLAARTEVNRLLGDARTEAAQLRHDANAEVDRLLTTAKTEADRLVTTAQTDADLRVTNAQTTADHLLTDAKAQANQHLTDANAEANRLVTTAQTEADQLLGDAMTDADRLRTEANHLLTNANAEADQLVTEADELLSEANAEADQLVTDAKTDASQRVDAAQHKVDQLRDLRGQIAAQVRAARDALAGVSPLLDESDESDPPPRQADIPVQRDRVAPAKATR